MPERSRMRKKVCKVWTVRNRPVNLTPRKRETRDLRIEASSSKRVQREGGSSSLWETIHIIDQMGEWKTQYVIWENIKNVTPRHMIANFVRYQSE